MPRYRKKPVDELVECPICNCELPHGQLIKCRQCGAWVCDDCYVYRGSVCVQCGDRPCHERARVRELEAKL